jgi:hypothetical protein
LSSGGGGLAANIEMAAHSAMNPAQVFLKVVMVDTFIFGMKV